MKTLFRTAVVLGASLVFGLGWLSHATATVLYATSGARASASSLYTIDTATGAATLVGAVGFTEVVSIDFHPTTGVLYGIANNGSAGGTLITINTATGAGTPVTGAAPIPFQSPDMSFRSDGTLFSWSEPGPDRLNRINITTGATTEVGLSGIGTALLGLDIDSSDVIYVKSVNQVYTVNPTTGAATLLQTLDQSFNNVLAFDPDDVLYTILRTGSDSLLYTIDLLSGTSTLVGATGVSNIGALAFVPSVPEPATLGLLAIALAGLGLRRRKHR